MGRTLGSQPKNGPTPKLPETLAVTLHQSDSTAGGEGERCGVGPAPLCSYLCLSEWALCHAPFPEEAQVLSVSAQILQVDHNLPLLAPSLHEVALAFL